MSPDPADFEFWVGEWDCTWDGGHGTNTVSKELGGRVLVERFETVSPEPFEGMSLTLFDDRAGIWRQAWADSSGNFWTFHGGLEADRMVLTTEHPDHEDALKRMVFFNIAAEQLDWQWERSDDGGRTWQALWTIYYRRRDRGDEAQKRGVNRP